jgi:hypothetical protein
MNSSPRFIKKGNQISGSAAARPGPVLQVQVTLEVLREMVGVSTGKGGADGTHNLLARITV